MWAWAGRTGKRERLLIQSWRTGGSARGDRSGVVARAALENEWVWSTGHDVTRILISFERSAAMKGIL